MFKMTRQQIQKFFFLSLLVLSLSSSIYINGEARDLKMEGFDVSYFSTEDSETLFPDARLLDHILNKLRDVVFVR